MIKESDRLIISTEVGGASELQSFRASELLYQRKVKRKESDAILY
jgi:hypothetical protein